MVDVLTVHFQKNTMRVRHPYVGTTDMLATEFFDYLTIVEKEKPDADK
jgi:hypothetical protein